MIILLIDNFDSFTFMLKDYIEQCGAECIVKRNNDDEILYQKFTEKFDAFIISPGPETPNKSNHLMAFIKINHTQKPILGICLGHQAIGEFFGATLVKSDIPKHGKVDKMIHTNHKLFEGIENNFTATRYHSLILQKIKEPLKIIATDLNGNAMGIAHIELPVLGIQFHPESCLTIDGIKIINNFVMFVRQNM